MPTFPGSAPISANLRLSTGRVVVLASDRTDTVVEVRPTDPAAAADLEAADRARVDFARGTLAVRIPEPLWPSGWHGRLPGSVDLHLEVPTGSSLAGGTGQGDLRTEGTLGEVRFGAGTGTLSFDRTGPLHVGTGDGDVIVEAVDGDAEITGCGAIRIGGLGGGATIKNSNGAISVGRAGGDLRARSSNGGISVQRAEASVNAATANGAIRIGAVSRGALQLATGAGTVEIGIRPGTAALLDLRSRYGSVRTELDRAAGPGPADERVSIHARSGFGDIVIRRA